MDESAFQLGEVYIASFEVKQKNHIKELFSSIYHEEKTKKNCTAISQCCDRICSCSLCFLERCFDFCIHIYIYMCDFFNIFIFALQHHFNREVGMCLLVHTK